MRTQEEVQTDLSENFDAQVAINNLLKIKRDEVVQLKSTQVDAVQQHATKAHKPVSLKNRRDELANIAAEIEELQMAKTAAEAQEQQLRNEQELITAYQKIASYSAAETAYFEKTKAVMAEAADVAKVLQQFQSAVEALKKTPNPIFTLESILKEVQMRNISLSAFFNGEIQNAELEKDNAFLKLTASKFREPLNFFRELKMPSLQDIGSAALSIFVINSGDSLKEFRIKSLAETSGKFDNTKEIINHNTEISKPVYTNRLSMYAQMDRDRMAKRKRENRGIFDK